MAPPLALAVHDINEFPGVERIRAGAEFQGRGQYVERKELTAMPTGIVGTAFAVEEASISQFLDTFLAGESHHLERLRNLTENLVEVMPYARAVPELIQRGKYQSACVILHAIDSWSATDLPSASGFQSLLEGVRVTVADGKLFSALMERFRVGSAEIRHAIVEVLAALARRGVPPLIELLLRSEDAELRRRLIGALAQIGSNAVWGIRLALERPNSPARPARDLLAALGQIGGLEAANTVQPLLHHPDASVREHALSAFTRISGRHAEAELLAALTDPDLAVRRRALVCLGSIGSINPRVVEFLYAVIRKRCTGEREEDDRLQIQACQGLVEVGRSSAALLPWIERILIQALHLDSRAFNGGRGGSVGKSDAVRGAICSALGQIGGANAAQTLRRLTEERNLLVQDRALRALRQLEERVGLQAA